MNSKQFPDLQDIVRNLQIRRAADASLDGPITSAAGKRPFRGLENAYDDMMAEAHEILDTDPGSEYEMQLLDDIEADCEHCEPEYPHAPHPLQAAFNACIQQVTKGKGERHGGEATPFFDQPWYSIAKQTGATGLIFQSMKKAGEACGKPDQETFERELLGSIVYAAMAYLYVQKHGFKNNV